MNKLKLYSIMALMASLTACSAYDDLVGNDDAAAGGIAVLAESGGTVDVTGEWIGVCYYTLNSASSGYTYAKDVLTISGTSVKFEQDEYGSSDTTCSSTPTRAASSAVYDMASDGSHIDTFGASVGADKAITGWRLGTISGTDTVAPNSLAGPALASTPTATTVTMKFTLQSLSDVYGAYRWVLYVDDSDSANGNLAMYYGFQLSITETYPDYLIADEPLTKTK